jgi:hypothetical protein
MAGGLLGFARTPLPSGGPPGHRGTAALLRAAAWLLLVAVGLGVLVAVPLLLFIWWGTLAFGGQGDLARVPIVAGIFLLSVAAALALVSFASRTYVAWTQRRPRSLAMARALAAILLAAAAFLAVTGFLPERGDPGTDAPSPVGGIVLAAAVAALAVAILVRSQGAGVRAWVQARDVPSAPSARPAAGPGIVYQCPRCRRSFQLATHPPPGALCPSCRQAAAAKR